VTTWISTWAAACAGLVTVSWLLDVILTLEPAAEPNSTDLTPVKPDPLTVIVVPPAVVPADGDTNVTTGTAS
jgi:hypothetical protein